MSKRRVVITGLGWVTSLGCEVNEVWQKLLAGTSGIHEIRRFNVDQHTSKIAGEVDFWDGKPHLEPKQCKRLDRFAQFGLASAIDAVADSGLDFSKEDPWRCGSVFGSGIGGIEEFEAGHKKMITRAPDRVSPFMIPKLMINAGAGNIAIEFGLMGPNVGTVTACASAGHAIADAYKTIACDEADIVITGGSEAAVSPLGVACFMTMRALSTRNDDPTRASRPFDVDRDGFVIAEGAGCMITEEYEHAKARGANIYAEIIGYGATCDAGHITAPDEEGRGAQQAMRNAIKMAGITPEQVSYVNPHATSTHLGDLAETHALKAVFGDHATSGNLAVGATKSMTGHLLGASGGIETVMTCKAIQTGDCPPTINLENRDEGCDLNYIANEAQHHDVKYAMSNNFGFGGHNISLLLAKI